MTLSRWRRLATGLAAGVLVLCAAMFGASMRSTTDGVSVASDLRPTNVTPIPDDADITEADEVIGVDETADADELDESSEAVDITTSDEEADPQEVDGDEAEPSEAGTDDTDSTDIAEDADDQDATTDADDEADPDATADDGDTDDDPDTADPDAATDDGSDEATDTAGATDGSDAADTSSSDSDAGETSVDESAQQPPPAPPTPTPIPAPAPPAPSNGQALGTGGGVNDAGCGIDRLVIYAGARVSGVAGRLRTALAQNGFGAGCPAPVTVLAANCPQQFAGVLRAGSGYDPSQPYVAASAAVDRDSMTAIVGATGYTGSTINILNFGFVNGDRPGERWIAIFVPPSFAGWEGLAGQAGLAPSGQSLCSASGELTG